MTDYQSEGLWYAIEECHMSGWTRERLMAEVNEHWVEAKRREFEAAEEAASKGGQA